MSRHSTFEKELEQYGYCTYFTVGTSMLPLLRARRDLVHLRKPEGPLRPNDVALFRRKNGQYVLHRAVRAGEGEYVFLGDNQIFREAGISHSQILGVMEGFTRNGKYHSVQEFPYKMYVFLWRGLYPLRYIWRRMKSACRHLKR